LVIEGSLECIASIVCLRSGCACQRAGEIVVVAVLLVDAWACPTHKTPALRCSAPATFGRAQAKLKNAEASASDAADKARKASSYAALWLFVSLPLFAH